MQSRWHVAFSGYHALQTDDICAVRRIPRKNPPKHAAFLRRSSSLCPITRGRGDWAGGAGDARQRSKARIIVTSEHRHAEQREPQSKDRCQGDCDFGNGEKFSPMVRCGPLSGRGTAEALDRESRRYQHARSALASREYYDSMEAAFSPSLAST